MGTKGVYFKVIFISEAINMLFYIWQSTFSLEWIDSWRYLQSKKPLELWIEFNSESFSTISLSQFCFQLGGLLMIIIKMFTVKFIFSSLYWNVVSNIWINKEKTMFSYIFYVFKIYCPNHIKSKWRKKNDPFTILSSSISICFHFYLLSLSSYLCITENLKVYYNRKTMFIFIIIGITFYMLWPRCKSLKI